MEAHNAEQIVAEVSEEYDEYGVSIDEIKDQEHMKVVCEGDDYVVFADLQGYELTECGRNHPEGYDAVEKAMHTMAGELCDYNWSAVWPVVVEK